MITKKKIWGIVVSILVALVGLCTVISLNDGMNESKQEKMNPINSQGSAVDTSDWLTYENKEYRYQFKYPKGVEVVDGKDLLYSPSGHGKSTVVIFPEAYPYTIYQECKNPDFDDHYEIDIIFLGNPRKFGETLDEIIKKLGQSFHLKEVFSRVPDTTIIVYGEGEQAYFIDENEVYTLYLTGLNPKFSEYWLKDHPYFSECVNAYLQYLDVLKGVYSTFETF